MKAKHPSVPKSIPKSVPKKVRALLPLAFLVTALGALVWMRPSPPEADADRIRALLKAGASPDVILPPTARGSARTPRWAEDRLIVRLRPGVPEARLEAILQRAGGAPRPGLRRALMRLRERGIHIADVPPGMAKRLAEVLRQDPDIAFAELDLYHDLGAVHAPELAWSEPYFWHLGKIRAPEAWNQSTGEGVRVAICDSGVDPGHPDLIDRLVPGWNVASDSPDTSPIHPHGTWVAGILVAAGDNGFGVPSVAWNAELIPVRVTDNPDGGAYTSDIAACILWAAEQGASIVNASYANLWDSPSITEAAYHLRALGGLLFVSAGNEGLYQEAPVNPAMIVVAATDDTDTRSSFSNFGPHVDLSAPGNMMFTTQDTANPAGSFALVAGTSFAAPLAAGTAALLKSAAPYLSPDQIEHILKVTAVDPTGEDFHPEFGFGRIDAAEAMLVALATLPDASPASVSLQGLADQASVNGQVLVQAAADDNGNRPARAAPAELIIESPDDGQAFAGTVAFSVQASGEAEIRSIRLFVNDELKAFCALDRCSAPVNSLNFADGPLQLRAEATDAAGNLTRLAREVMVQN